MTMTRLCFLLATVVACAGKVPETRYYQLASPAADIQKTNDGAVLAIEPLETDQAYDDERMVYRLTPYRLDYYNYHRWSSAPGALIADYLERAFERSGRFRSVTRNGSGAPVTLNGRVIAIEEVDVSKTKWIGRVVVELRLVDAEGKTVWTEQYEEKEPLKTQTPEGLAAALSLALGRIAASALPSVADVAVRTAAAGAAKSTGPLTPDTRAARSALRSQARSRVH